MNDRSFEACFSIFRHKEGAVAPVDYSSTFATASFLYSLIEAGFCCLLTRSCLFAMKWVGLMNNVRSSAEEIVLKELIYV